MDRILLIDDNPLDRQLVTMMVNGNHKIVSAETLEEGLSLAKSIHPSMAILDLMLPDTSPHAEELDGLKRFRAEAPDVPVLVVTGHEDPALLIKAMTEGAKDYIVKTRLSADSLLSAIKATLQSGERDKRISKARAERVMSGEAVDKCIREVRYA